MGKSITLVGFEKGRCPHCDKQKKINDSLRRCGITSKKRILKPETGTPVAPHTILDDGKGNVKLITGVVERDEIMEFMGVCEKPKKLSKSRPKKKSKKRKSKKKAKKKGKRRK